MTDGTALITNPSYVKCSCGDGFATCNKLDGTLYCFPLNSLFGLDEGTPCRCAYDTKGSCTKPEGGPSGTGVPTGSADINTNTTVDANAANTLQSVSWSVVATLVGLIALM